MVTVEIDNNDNIMENRRQVISTPRREKWIIFVTDRKWNKLKKIISLNEIDYCTEFVRIIITDQGKGNEKKKSIVSTSAKFENAVQWPLR